MNYKNNILPFLFLGILLKGLIYSQGDLFISGNSGPVANAGRDIKTLSKGSIFLDGSQSYVTDGSTIKYHWEFSPGLVLNSDNDFSQEISTDSFGETYLKSVITFKDVLDVKLAENNPGTKLEVVLKIKDRIGFEDRDTLIVEYFDPTIPEEEILDTMIVSSDSLFSTVADTDTVVVKNFGKGILIQSYAEDEIPQMDIEIINSIIFNQIQEVGFNAKVYINKDLKKPTLSEDYNFFCKDDECVSKNASLLNAKYVLVWEFAESEDLFYIRVFDSMDYNNWIANDILSDPYKVLSESGIYGLDPLVRTSVTRVMSAKNFKNEISVLNRFKMKNEVLVEWGKYPIWAGITYLILDKVFAPDSKEPLPTQPPGFPHD
tara:strand:+ start:3988 stop:5112 length:1125 start_codon:yes stop_codon:yes gene_type:complete